MSETLKSSVFIKKISYSLKSLNFTLKSVIITIEVFNMTVLGKRLKQARKNKGITQMDAANILGISNGTLSGYERNYRDPDTETLNKMANLYEVSNDWLLGKSDNPERNNDIVLEDDIDPELQKFIEEVKVWYKDEPESKEEKLKMFKKMFEAFKD